jgi:hypothetical protein
MTTDEILAGIDQSLAAIAAERERLLAARTQLAGTAAPAVPTPPRRTPSRRSRRARGGTQTSVLEALDPTTPRTAGDIERLTNVPRALAGTTLSRLVKQGHATKADRGYLRVSA